MSSGVAIKAENISKAYQLGQFSTGTVSRDLERWWVTKVRQKEDPFLKIGEANDRASKGESDIVWSLKDINFEIQQGDAVGIIGRNGAGKSTLLKVLSQVTTPTTGSVKVKGRIASLLEVGTGFHPELTGRENIYLNGAILGMRKKEIKRRFDEIVDFSGVERYIDTPVKRYSSGMYVRLAFAVAAHLESEILIVDEVLAVGDAEFQRKCIGKMGDVSRGEGRTVLFVSHNLGMVKKLCNDAILLHNGVSKFHGRTEEVLDMYIDQFQEDLSTHQKFPLKSNNNTVEILKFNWLDSNYNETHQYRQEEELRWEVVFKTNIKPRDFNIVVAVENLEGDRIVSFTSKPSIIASELEEGSVREGTGSYKIDLKPGKYYCAFGVRFNEETVLYEPQLNYFEIVDSSVFEGQNGKIFTRSQWKLK